MSEIMVREPEAPRKKSRKKRIIIIAALAVLALAAFLIIRFFMGGAAPADQWEDGEYVDVPSVNYYNGVIEPQKTWDIQKDGGREVDQVFVTVGQNVIIGQQLFSYKSDDLKMQLKQAQLELNGIRNEIESEDAQVFGLWRADGFKFQESEIDEIRFWPPEKLFDPRERENFTPNLCAELDKLREIGLI